MEPIKAPLKGKPWTMNEDIYLLESISEDHPTREIAAHLGRTRNSVIGRYDRLTHPRNPQPEPEDHPDDHPHRKPGRLEFLRTRG